MAIEPVTTSGSVGAGPVVVLTAGGTNPSLVINALARRFPDVRVIREQSESKKQLLARRVRRCGRLNAYGQLATMAAAKFLRKGNRARVEEIIRSTGYAAEIPANVPVADVTSINDPACLDAIRAIAPSVVLLISTRMMKAAVIAQIPCPLINVHAGVNPGYRGQFGGYWSLVERDEENFGATIHLVDAGTDTGETLYIARTRPAKGDNTSTYPLVITAAAVDVTLKAVDDALNGRLDPHPATGSSVLRFPPTVWFWLWTGLTRNIW